MKLSTCFSLVFLLMLSACATKKNVQTTTLRNFVLQGQQLDTLAVFINPAILSNTLHLSVQDSAKETHQQPTILAKIKENNPDLVIAHHHKTNVAITDSTLENKTFLPSAELHICRPISHISVLLLLGVLLYVIIRVVKRHMVR